MSQRNKTNSASASERIGLLTLKASLKQLLAEGTKWEAKSLGPDGGIVLTIPAFNIATGEDGRFHIVEREQ